MHRKALFGRFRPRAVPSKSSALPNQFRRSFEPLEARDMLAAQDLLVVDYANQDVLRYNDDTSTAVSGGVPSSGGLSFPDGVAVAQDGSYYVSDPGAASVQHYNSAGTFLGALPAYDALPTPASLAFGPNGNLYIVDAGYSGPNPVNPANTLNLPAAIYQYNPSTQQIVTSATISLPQYYNDDGNAVYPGGLAFATNGDILFGNLDDGSLTQFHVSGSSVTATTLFQSVDDTQPSTFYFYLASQTDSGASNDYSDSDDPIPEPGGILALSNGDVLIADLDLSFTAASQSGHHQILEYIPASGSNPAQVKQFIDVGADGTSSPQQQPTSIILDTDGNLLVGMNPDDGLSDGSVAKFNIFTGASMGTVISGIGVPAGLALIPQAPTVATSSGATGYTAGAGGVPVDSKLMASTASDDNVNLDGATISISGGFQSGDTLSFNNTAHISGVVTSPGGVYTLTLSGSDTAADYQAALESITFSNTTNPTDTATRTISFTVTDGTATSLTATKQIKVAAQDLLVVDYANQDVLRYNDDTSTAVSGGVPSSGGLSFPDGVAVAQDGSYYVSDPGAASVQHYNSAGTFLGALPAYDALPTPASLAFGPNGNLYIVDAGYSGPNPVNPANTLNLPAAIYQYNPSTQQIVTSATISLPQYYNDDGNAVYPGGLAFATNGDILFGNLDDGSLTQFHVSGSSVTATTLFQSVDDTQPSTFYFYLASQTDSGASNDYSDSDDPIPEPGGILALSNGDVLIADLDLSFTAASQSGHHQILEYIPASGSNPAQVKQFIDVGADGTSSPQQQPTSIILDTDGNLLVGMNPDDGLSDGSVAKFNIFTGASMGTVISGIGVPAGLALIPQAPTVATSSGATGYTAGAGGVPVDSKLMASTASDDNVNLDGATISISGGFQSGDTLNFNNTAHISGVVTSPGGVYTLTLSGSDTAADYQAALQSITFSSSSTSTATRTISFTVTDGAETSVTATKQISVFAPAEVSGVFVNDPSIWGAGGTSSFDSYLAGESLGSSTLGYSLTTGANQLLPLPWDNINTISVQFNQNVPGMVGTTSPGGVELLGSTDASYAAPPALSTATYSYNATTFVATWQFPSAFLSVQSLLLVIPAGTATDSRGAPLDGEWTTSTSTTSGNGLAGGNFDFFFNVLPGDADRNGTVAGQDVAVMRTLQSDTTTSNTPGTTYSPYYDVDGNGTINGTDVAQTRLLQSGTLPTDPPVIPSIAAPGNDAASPDVGPPTPASNAATLDSALASGDAASDSSQVPSAENSAPAVSPAVGPPTPASNAAMLASALAALSSGPVVNDLAVDNVQSGDFAAGVPEATIDQISLAQAGASPGSSVGAVAAASPQPAAQTGQSASSTSAAGGYSAAVDNVLTDFDLADALQGGLD